MARIEVFKTELSLPMVSVHATGIAEGWEAAVLACWEHGGRIPTQYDQEGDPVSRDMLLSLVVEDPFAEPRVHRAFPDSVRGLEVYRREMLEGLHHEHREQVGSYDYYGRLFRWPFPMGVDSDGKPKPSQSINQIGKVIEELIRISYTRRAVAITWLPWDDIPASHPPCLQQIWCRIFNDRLAMNVLMRSNDAWKAAFMNMYAFTDLQRTIAERVSAGLGRTVTPGQYAHVAWSFHIYGSDFPDFEGFLRSVEKRSWEERTWHTDSPMFQELLAEADVEIARSLRHEAKTGQKGIYECTCCREGE